jgi:NAD dependent epimerase/dehydratase family enzyme
MAPPTARPQPVAMNDLANELARLLAKEHQTLVRERAGRIAAEEAAAQLVVLVEREREARRQAEAQAHELSTLILGDEPARPAPRFIPQRTPLRSVS